MIYTLLNRKENKKVRLQNARNFIWLKIKMQEKVLLRRVNKFNQKIKMKIFLTLLLSIIINQVCINGAITLSGNETSNKVQMIERDANHLNRKSLNKKRGFFGTRNLFDIRLRSLAGELKQTQKSQNKENEMKFEQEIRDKIYRQYLAQQSSFHRDFHTSRY
jgi:hypothetical protein